MGADKSVYIFFGSWQIVVCFFAFAALITIWLHFSRNQVASARDKGLWWLSLSVLVWAFSGGLELAYVFNYEASTNKTDFDIAANSGRSILSILNSTFILFSLPYFKHKPATAVFERILEPKSWSFWIKIIAAIFILLTVSTTIFSLSMSNAGSQVADTLLKTINVADILYAFLTLIILGIALWTSFDARGLRVMAALTVFCIAFTFVAQVFKILDNDFLGIFFSCAFKTMLIMIFFALALSWVAEEIENEYLPKLDALSLDVLNAPEGKKSMIILSIPPAILNQQISMNKAPFIVLESFARKRKTEGEKGGWLKVKPKNADTRHDIKDYNQIKSIFKEILNHLYGKGNWSNQELNFIRKSLIERHPQKEGFYRLRITPSKIKFEA